MNASAFRDIWARVMILNLKNITCAQISRNALEFIRFSTRKLVVYCLYSNSEFARYFQESTGTINHS